MATRRPGVWVAKSPLTLHGIGSKEVRQSLLTRANRRHILAAVETLTEGTSIMSSLFEITDEAGNVVARARVKPVAITQADKLSRERHMPLLVKEIVTVKTERLVHKAN